MVFRNGGIVKQIEKWYFEGVEILYTKINLDQNERTISETSTKSSC